MQVKQIVGKLKNHDGLAYTFGRFRPVRGMYASAMRCKQMFSAQSPIGTQETIFPSVNTKAALAELRRDAVCFGFDLTPEAAKIIYDYSCSQPLSHNSIAGTFNYSQVTGGKLPDGRMVAMGYVDKPLDCPVVRATVEDPKMQWVCRRYLGYVPLHVDVNLYWSFAAKLNLEERRKFNQTVEYHFDVHDFNFCYAHFYITDCDENSGAHVMVRGSHRHKKLSWLLGSARKGDAEVNAAYPAKDILVIKGRAGTGFIEDTSCYHKAIAPVERDRLLFQIRYH
ncbi:MAG TPA: hypothetical protein VMG59_06605 [Phycisphaerae bacterium]|nr:hypothetical protein [Phycisphaerae bacterium]